MKISFAKRSLPAKGVLVITAATGPVLGQAGQDVDAAMDSGLTRALKVDGFKGKRGQSVTLLAPAGTSLDRVIVIGVGDPDSLDAQALQNLGGKVTAALAQAKAGKGAVIVDAFEGMTLDIATAAANLGVGAFLRSYSFDKYLLTDGKPDGGSESGLSTLKVICDENKAASAAYGPLSKIADGVLMTRDLVSEPANVLYPESLAARAKELEADGVKVTVLGEKEMQKLGMNALLGVGQGSIRESQLVVMEWKGAPAAGKGKKRTPPVAVVGKGVTFDTGGISIKPSAGMEDMKWDMGGAGVVIGLMKALAGRKAKVDVVGVVGLVENMPGGAAQRPGDIVKSASGKTIEVLNTDAEGRLVLADALWYAQKHYSPGVMIDLATLTGAILVSLAGVRAGLFTNDDDLAKDLYAAGEVVEEKLWRMPMDDAYDKLIKSPAADVKNIGGRWGGSISAAKFLQRFVEKDVKWAHLDIAGVTWSGEGNDLAKKGGTGFGVRLLDRFLADNHEAK